MATKRGLSSRCHCEGNEDIDERERSRRAQELRLDRKEYEDASTLASIVRALDVLESSNVKDLLGKDEYVTNCKKLLRQLRTQKKAMESTDDGSFGGIESFLDKYGYACEHARHRINVGIPDDPDDNESGGGAKSVYAFELVRRLISSVRNATTDRANDSRNVRSLSLSGAIFHYSKGQSRTG